MMSRANDDSQMKHCGNSAIGTNDGVRQFNAEWDDEGVYFYQAYNDEIADWAIKHQTFTGCPSFRPLRMTWLKPSFAWMLYRSGYGCKANQERILKIKLGHRALGWLLSRCVCSHSQGGAMGRVQWDPERDILTVSSDRGRVMVPGKMLRLRAIQIGISRELSKEYVKTILKIEDVTKLAHMVKDAHQELTRNPNPDAIRNLLPRLPFERPYLPDVEQAVLEQIALAPGEPTNSTSTKQQY